MSRKFGILGSLLTSPAKKGIHLQRQVTFIFMVKPCPVTGLGTGNNACPPISTVFARATGP